MNYGFHPEARLEYREATEFYDSRRPGLGAEFTREIEGAIEQIIESPERWRVLDRDVRRCLAHIFPYGVLYTIESDFILIEAISHGSRKPGYWCDRLSGSV